MNDLRRTLLWSVFAVSLLMLWDGWLRHTGQPSLFAPAPAPVASVASAPASGAGAADVPQSAQALGSPAQGAAQAAAGASAPEAPGTPKGELITIGTDVVKATIDTLGASLVRVELLKHKDQDDKSRNVVVLEQSKAHTYLAQSGLVGSASLQLPTH